MSSINGVTLKNVKTFRGHDGSSYYQGSVYLNGKRLGSWSQDAWCGPDIVDFPTEKLQEIAKYLVTTSFVETPYKGIYNWSCLLDDVLHIKLLEDYYKSIRKKGYTTVVTIQNKRYNINVLGYCKIPKKDKQLAIKCFEKDINSICNKYQISLNILEINLYHNLEDFEISL